MINVNKIHTLPARCTSTPMCALHEQHVTNMRQERDTALAAVGVARVETHKAKHATSRARIWMAVAILVAALCAGHSAWIAGV